MKFAKTGLGVKIDYRKVFPVIQSYNVGQSEPYWSFKPHAKYPLKGSQFVYAVVVAKAGTDGIRAYVDLRAMVDTKFGPMWLGLPEEARANTRFMIP